jgi:hypothetical protein
METNQNVTNLCSIEQTSHHYTTQITCSSTRVNGAASIKIKLRQQHSTT